MVAPRLGVALCAALSISLMTHLPVNAVVLTEQQLKVKEADQKFAAIKQKFLVAVWQNDADLALFAGKFTHADKLAVPDQASRDNYLKFAESWLQQLQQVDATQLSAREQTDLVLMQNYLKSNRWYLSEFREYEWNPSQYNVAGGFDSILSTEFAPKAVRIKLAIKRLQAVPAYYQAARANLKDPTLEHTRLALRQLPGVLGVFDNLASQAAEIKLASSEQTALNQNLQQARQAVSEYQALLKQWEEKLQNGKPRSFRIGKDLYEGKFKADIQSDLSAEAAYQKALAAKEANLQNMDKLADQLWSKVMGEQAKPADRLQKIAQVIAKLSEQHVAAKDFVSEIRKQIPQLEKWVKDKDLLTIDSKKPLVVRETPVYQRGVAGASIEAPGVFRPNDKTYYNVTPLEDEAGGNAEQIESTLREYNHWVLQILNIHEAIPGHYTQLQHANRSPSIIKALFGNGAMIEGWAVYSERMMMESGYGGNTPEMWLMYYKWNLRAICNTILDYSVHVLNMSEAEAKDLLMNQAFQTKAEADGKWNRVQYTSVQLSSYFSGYADIMDLRESYKQQVGDRFKLKDFHEQFLSYGSAPVGQIKNLMLGQDKK